MLRAYSAGKLARLATVKTACASRIEAELTRWVSRLRERGTDWQRIADALGTSIDAVRQRFEAERPV